VPSEKPRAEALDGRTTVDHVAYAARRMRDLPPLNVGLLGGTCSTGVANPRLGYRALARVMAC
jgi:hypothetical protein